MIKRILVLLPVVAMFAALLMVACTPVVGS